MNFDTFALSDKFSLEKNLKALDLCNKTYPQKQLSKGAL